MKPQVLGRGCDGKASCYVPDPLIVVIAWATVRVSIMSWVTAATSAGAQAWAELPSIQLSVQNLVLWPSPMLMVVEA